MIVIIAENILLERVLRNELNPASSVSWQDFLGGWRPLPAASTPLGAPRAEAKYSPL
ncbi:MAG: hypothetical protein LBQ83_06235 [Candidatus Margulisbacteria bacterium]|nr:hypothetical protein [Candidatus Margulisiibacteriota bacterium]